MIRAIFNFKENQNKEELKNEDQKKIEEEQNEDERENDERGDKVVALPRWRRLRWIAAAAAIAGALLISKILFFQKPQNSQSNISTTKNNDIAPGGNRATLTLGNGAAMILDSEATGNLAQQGNTVISKIDSGRLAYTVENNKPNEKPGTIEENVLTTPRGGQYQLDLPDGTKVWLNSASSITYPTAFSGNQRFVIVTGEVYFEVVHNSNMPFVVKTTNSVITDLGTQFNINAYPEEESDNNKLFCRGA